MKINNEELSGALTLDQLIGELQAAKDSGLATGQELVAFGSDFMGRCMAVKSAVIMPNEDGDVSFGLSSEPESAWAKRMQGEANNLQFIDPQALPESDPLETARLHGFDKRVAEIEAERLAISAAPKKKAWANNGCETWRRVLTPVSIMIW